MNVNTHETTTVLAAGLGALVALTGVATLVGMPWQQLNGGAVLTAGRILGALLAVGIGIGTAWLALTD